MLSPGFAIVLVLIATLTIFGILRIRVFGWGGIVLGTCGIIYSIATYPEYILLAVFPLSVIVFLIGCVTVVRRHLRNPS